jgi:predicted 2-oxoglutarate/Fe(II)-dependent dioxygenase YbiX
MAGGASRTAPQARKVDWRTGALVWSAPFARTIASMPNATILAQLGLFVRRRFLNAESCRQIRREMTEVARVPAMIRPYGQGDVVLDDKTRRTGVANVSAATTALVEDQLRAVQPALEAFFRAQSAGWQDLRFYIYEEGDFFAVHRDASPADRAAPDWAKRRQFSVSILLNDQRSGPDTEPYGGGTLVFHGRRGGPEGAWFSIPLEAEEGMFVAFPSHWMHEVQPVTSGRRYSIVTWFI